MNGKKYFQIINRNTQKNLIKKSKIIQKFNLDISVLARGIPVGDQLEYTDEVTLARSIQNRRPYESNLKND